MYFRLGSLLKNLKKIHQGFDLVRISENKIIIKIALTMSRAPGSENFILT
jgi:hypothetical protein